MTSASSETVIRWHPRQLLVFFGFRVLITVSFVAALALLAGADVDRVAMVMVLGVIVAFDLIAVWRMRRYGLRLDAEGLREAMPNGGRRYWFGPAGPTATWDEVTSVGVEERRWSTRVAIATDTTVYRPAMPTRWRWFDANPDFEQDVALIRDTWAKHRMVPGR